MSLENRVERLERQNRKLKLAFLLVSICFGLMFVLASTASNEHPSELRCRSLRVVSEDGKTMILLDGHDGCGGISLWDTTRETGKPLLSIGVISRSTGGGGTQIYMKDADVAGAINLVAIGKKGNVWYTGASGKRHLK